MEQIIMANNLMDTINNFIEDLMIINSRMNRTTAAQATKDALKNQVNKYGYVSFEVDGVTHKFKKSELKAIWKDIK